MLFQTTNLSSPVPITLTANGVYTEPNGLGYSPVTVNVSGGGVSIAKAIIRVYYPSGSVCTCSKGSTSLQSDTSGKYLFCLPSSGTWTLTCGSVTSTVTVDEYAFENAYVGGLDALKARCKLTNYVRLSNAIGDKALSTNEGDRWAERTTDEYTLIVRCDGGGNYDGYAFISKINTVANTHNSFGDVSTGIQFTAAGKTLYLCKMSYMVLKRTGLQITTDGITETYGTDTYVGTDGTTYGTNAVELQGIIEEYANTID